jgi:hypothetical protein
MGANQSSSNPNLMLINEHHLFNTNNTNLKTHLNRSMAIIKPQEHQQQSKNSAINQRHSAYFPSTGSYHNSCLMNQQQPPLADLDKSLTDEDEEVQENDYAENINYLQSLENHLNVEASKKIMTKKPKKLNKLFKILSINNNNNSSDVKKRDGHKVANRKNKSKNIFTKSLILISNKKEEIQEPSTKMNNNQLSSHLSINNPHALSSISSASTSSSSSSGCSSGASSSNLSAHRRINHPSLIAQNYANLCNPQSNRPSTANNTQYHLSSSSTHSILSSHKITTSSQHDKCSCCTPNNINNNNNNNINNDFNEKSCSFRTNSYLTGLNNSSFLNTASIGLNFNNESISPDTFSSFINSCSSSSGGGGGGGGALRRAENRKKDHFKLKSKSLYAGEGDESIIKHAITSTTANITATTTTTTASNSSSKKPSFKSRFSLKYNKNGALKSRSIKSASSRDSGIITDYLSHLSQMGSSVQNLKMRLTNATESLRNSFSVFNLKTSNTSRPNNNTSNRKSTIVDPSCGDLSELSQFDSETSRPNYNTSQTNRSSLLMLKRGASTCSSSNPNPNAALNSNLNPISFNHHPNLKRTTTFHSTSDANNNNRPVKNYGSFLNTNAQTQPPKSAKNLITPTTNATKTISTVKNTHKHQKIVVQASTNDLLRCLVNFMSKKCSHLIKPFNNNNNETEIDSRCSRSGSEGSSRSSCSSDDSENEFFSPPMSCYRVECKDVLNWLRNADRILLLQGWQDVAFMNPVNVVFVYLLLKESLPALMLPIMKSAYDLQCNLMSCLYLAFSYMGNEISYPLKPFLVEENRDVFWSRTINLMNVLSSCMIRINQDARYFTELFYELKSFSIEIDTIIPNPSLNHQIHKSFTVNSSLNQNKSEKSNNNGYSNQMNAKRMTVIDPTKCSICVDDQGIDKQQQHSHQQQHQPLLQQMCTFSRSINSIKSNSNTNYFPPSVQQLKQNYCHSMSHDYPQNHCFQNNVNENQLKPIAYCI